MNYELRSPFSDKGDREVFGDVSAVFEGNDECDVEFDLVSAFLDSAAAEEAGEDHVNIDLKVAGNVAVTNLNVLDFCSFFAKAFC